MRATHHSRTSGSSSSVPARRPSDVAADVSRTARVVHVVMRSPTFWLARHAPFFPPDYLEMRLLFMLRVSCGSSSSRCP